MSKLRHPIATLMEDLGKSIKAWLYDRASSPFYSTFIMTWCIWNWKIFYVTLFVSEQIIGNKLVYIQDHLSGWYVGLVFPLFSTIAIIGLFPWITRLAERVTLWHKERTDEMRDEYDTTPRLDYAEASNIMQQTREVSVKFIDVISSKDEEIRTEKELTERLRDELEMLKKETEGLKILRAEYGVSGDFIDVKDQLNKLVKKGSLDIKKIDDDFFQQPNSNPENKLTAIWVNGHQYYNQLWHKGQRVFIPSLPMMKAIDEKPTRIDD